MLRINNEYCRKGWFYDDKIIPYTSMNNIITIKNII